MKLVAGDHRNGPTGGDNDRREGPETEATDVQTAPARGARMLTERSESLQMCHRSANGHMGIDDTRELVKMTPTARIENLAERLPENVTAFEALLRIVTSFSRTPRQRRKS